MGEGGERAGGGGKGKGGGAIDARGFVYIMSFMRRCVVQLPGRLFLFLGENTMFGLINFPRVMLPF